MKICDFGLARPYGSPLKDYTVPVVTLYYRSIELLLGATSYSTPVDMWSVGCILGEMLQTRPVFYYAGQDKILDKVCRLFGTPSASHHKKFQTYKKWKEIAPSLRNYAPRENLREAFPHSNRSMHVLDLL